MVFMYENDSNLVFVPVISLIHVLNPLRYSTMVSAQVNIARYKYTDVWRILLLISTKNEMRFPKVPNAITTGRKYLIRKMPNV